MEKRTKDSHSAGPAPKRTASASAASDAIVSDKISEMVSDVIAGIFSGTFMSQDLENVFAMSPSSVTVTSPVGLLADPTEHPFAKDLYFNFALEYVFPHVRRELCVVYGPLTTKLLKDTKCTSDDMIKKLFLENDYSLSREMFPIADSVIQFPYRAIAFILHDEESVHYSVAFMYVPFFRATDASGDVELYHFDSSGSGTNDELARRLADRLLACSYILGSSVQRIRVVRPAVWGPQLAVTCATWCLCSMILAAHCLTRRQSALPSETLCKSVTNARVMGVYEQVVKTYRQYQASVYPFYSRYADHLLRNRANDRTVSDRVLAGFLPKTYDNNTRQLLLQVLPRMTIDATDGRTIMVEPQFDENLIRSFVRQICVCDSGLDTLCATDPKNLIEMCSTRIRHLQSCADVQLKEYDANSTSLPPPIVPSFYAVAVLTFHDEIAFVTCRMNIAKNEEGAAGPLTVYTSKSVAAARLLNVVSTNAVLAMPATKGIVTSGQREELLGKQQALGAGGVGRLVDAILQLYSGLLFIERGRSLAESVRFVNTSEVISAVDQKKNACGKVLAGVQLLRMFLSAPHSFPADPSHPFALCRMFSNRFATLIRWRYLQFAMSIALHPIAAREAVYSAIQTTLASKDHLLPWSVATTAPAAVSSTDDVTVLEEDNSLSNIDLESLIRATWKSVYWHGSVNYWLRLDDYHLETRVQFHAAEKKVREGGIVITHPQQRIDRRTELFSAISEKDDYSALQTRCPQMSLDCNSDVASLFGIEEDVPIEEHERRGLIASRLDSIKQLCPWKKDFLCLFKTSETPTVDRSNTINIVIDIDNPAATTACIGLRDPETGRYALEPVDRSFAGLVPRDVPFPLVIHSGSSSMVLLPSRLLIDSSYLIAIDPLYTLIQTARLRNDSWLVGRTIRTQLEDEFGICPQFFFASDDICLHLELQDMRVRESTVAFRGTPLPQLMDPARLNQFFLGCGMAAATAPDDHPIKAVLANSTDKKLLLESVLATDMILATLLYFFRHSALVRATQSAAG